MQNPDNGFFDGPSRYGSGSGPTTPGGNSILSLVLLVAAVVVAAIVLVSVVFWAFGLLFGLANVLIRVALVVAVAAFVWRRVSRGRSRRCNPERYDY